MAEMRPGNDDSARRSNEGLVDIALAERHVGAVFAIEDQRKLRVVTDAEDYQRGQPFRIDLHSLRRHALAGELFEDEASHVLIADAADQSRLQAQSRAATSDIGRSEEHTSELQSPMR